MVDEFSVIVGFEEKIFILTRRETHMYQARCDIFRQFCKHETLQNTTQYITNKHTNNNNM